MPWITFGPFVAYDAAGGIASNAVGKLYDVNDTTFSTPLVVQDASGVPIPDVTATADGVVSPFRLEDRTEAYWRSGSYTVYVQSLTGVREQLTALDVELNTITTDATNLGQRVTALEARPTGGTGGGGVTDHGALSGLADDNHPHYLTSARGDARYYTRAQADAATTSAVTTSSTGDRNRANHTGTQAISTVSNLETRLTALEGGAGGGGGAVSSVQGRTGAVVVTKADVGLGNADNTSDVAKPVSQATQAALNAKVSGTGVSALWKGTRAAYDAIASKSATTIYVITEA